MNLPITPADRKRFDAIRKQLDLLGNRESTFLQVELLFFEALNIAKTYGDDVQANALLAAFRNVQAGAYEKTREACKTSAQKERLIRQFTVQFKKALATRQSLS